MCGRFAVTTDPALLAEKIQAIDEITASAAAATKDTPGPNYNVAPTTTITTVVKRHNQPDDESTRRVRLMRWGLVPPWAKTAGDGGPDTKGPLLINARSEKVTASPAFRNSAKSKRCLVPMDGWYEWRPNGDASGRKAPKTPFYMYGGDGEMLFMAGLWSTWRPKDAPKDAPPFASNNAAELRRYAGIPKTGPVPDATARTLIQGYNASVSFVDAQVGKVLAELDRLKLRDNTIIILWGDHGYQLGEHGTWTKRTDWEIATRVPLLLAIPGQTTRGQRTAALVEFVDVYPTLAELCKLPLPPKLEGQSATPLLADPNAKWKTAAFSIYQKKIPALGGVAHGRAVVTDRHRLIEWSGKDPAKRVYELYHHQTDPQENTNIANLPENKSLVASLAKLLDPHRKAAAAPAADE